MSLTRLNPIAPKSTALLVIDVQNGTYSDKERAKRPISMIGRRARRSPIS
jgi:nicotinamidase-related amidase